MFMGYLQKTCCYESAMKTTGLSEPGYTETVKKCERPSHLENWQPMSRLLLVVSKKEEKNHNICIYFGSHAALNVILGSRKRITCRDALDELTETKMVKLK